MIQWNETLTDLLCLMGEYFEYWKDILKSFFISLDPEFWDLIEDGTLLLQMLMVLKHLEKK